MALIKIIVSLSLFRFYIIVKLYRYVLRLISFDSWIWFLPVQSFPFGSILVLFELMRMNSKFIFSLKINENINLKCIK